MSGIFHGTKIPAPAALPQPPGLGDAAVQAAGAEARANAAAAYGRYQTILTSGMGVTQPATVSKKVLLGDTGHVDSNPGSPLDVMTNVVNRGELSKRLNVGGSTY